MVHRDMRGVSERFSASRRLSRGRSSRPQAPALTIAKRAVNNGLAGYREVAAGGGGTLAVPGWVEAANT